MVTNKRKISQNFDIPDDLKEQASDTFTQARKMVDAGTQFGQF